MKCNACPLNKASISYDASLFGKVPTELHGFFECGGRELSDSQLVHQICPLTVWTVAYIGANDSFAMSQVEDVLEELVVGGHAELLCAMFENASYKIRKKMWRIMTTRFTDKIYLFDSLFEKEELEPFTRKLFKNIHKYKHYIMYDNYNYQYGYRGA
jgi:hypothetical protein